MIARELINDMIPPLKPTDRADQALAWMEEFRTRHLPVVEDGRFLGLLGEEQILEGNDRQRPVKEFELLCSHCFVHDWQYFYEVLKLAVDNQVDLVGVVDEHEEFLGVITVQDTIIAFAQTTPVQAAGSVIVLAMDSRDYSLTEISRLVEENNARILSSSIKQDTDDPHRIKVVLKINREDVSAILATLERFGYKVISRFQETEVTDTDRERIDELLKYLDI